MDEQGPDFNQAAGRAFERIDSALGAVARRAFGQIPEDVQRERWSVLKDNPTGRAQYIDRLARQSGQPQTAESLAALEGGYVRDMRQRYGS